MNRFDIPELVEAQSSLRRRKEMLVALLRPLRSGVVSGLTQILAEGTAAGLEGLTQLQITREADDYFEATLSLGLFRLVMVSTDQVWFADLLEDVLASKIFFCIADHHDGRPVAVITLQEAPNDQVVSSAKWFSSDGPKWLAGNTPVSPDNATSIGSSLAGALAAHFLAFQGSWNDLLTLAGLKSSETVRRDIGFKLQP